MSEHELNQMHDWEDKCNELTSEQRDWIIDIAEDLRIDCQNPYDVISGWKRFEDTINANTEPEDELICPRCWGRLVQDLNNNWSCACVIETDKEIALRKIKEWYKTAKVLDDGDRNAYFRIKKWLQQEDMVVSNSVTNWEDAERASMKEIMNTLVDEMYERLMQEEDGWYKYQMHLHKAGDEITYLDSPSLTKQQEDEDE